MIGLTCATMKVSLWVVCTLVARTSRFGLSSFAGEDMVANTKARPTPDHVETVADIDEALTHAYASRVSNPLWDVYADTLLDKRLQVSRPIRETRVLHAPETRDL